MDLFLPDLKPANGRDVFTVIGERLLRGDSAFFIDPEGNSCSLSFGRSGGDRDRVIPLVSKASGPKVQDNL